MQPFQHFQLANNKEFTSIELRQIHIESGHDRSPFTITERLTELRQAVKNNTVLIAICDTGIDAFHEDLAGHIIANANFSDSESTGDINGHGTHIAGIIAANDSNGFGIKGIAPGSRLLNVKITDDDGIVSSSSLSDGIIWAVDNGARVINMSFTIDEPVRNIQKAVEYAWDRGALVIAAVDNYSNTVRSYPGGYANCIAVTTEEIASGPLCDIYADVEAPGRNIYSTLPHNRYGYKSGTSMSTAYVSAIAGLLFCKLQDSNDNGRINDEVRYEIINRCNDLGIKSVGQNTRATEQEPGISE